MAERFEEAAGHKTIEVDLALLTHDDEMRSELELLILQTATQHDAQPLYLCHTVPGMGTILSLVLRYAIHDSDRFRRGQDCASSCRLGTSGNTIGNAPLQWAFAEAATLLLRGNEPGQT